MACALSLILWMTTAQTAGHPATQPAPAAAPTPAPVAVPATVVVQSVPNDSELALRAQLEEVRARLDEARDQIAKLKAESGLADNAIAALLLSDHPELATLRRWTLRYVRNGTRAAEIGVYASKDRGDTMVAVIVALRNPRDQKTWEPTKAWVSTPFGLKSLALRLRPVPAAVRSAPQRILPGQSARIAVVFDKADFDFIDGPFKVRIERDDQSAFEFVLEPSDFPSTSATEG